MQAEATAQRRPLTRRRTPVTPPSCALCGRAAVPLEEALGLFGLERGKIYRNIDRSAIHCQRRDDGRFWICVASVLRLHA